MAPKILPISERGQITLPKKIRDKIQVRLLTCEIENGNVVLKPLKTRDEFFAELENAETDWEENGGLTLEKMKAKYNIK